MKAKKLFLPLVALMMMLLASSCSKDVTIAYEYTVYPNQWVTEPGINYYYATFENVDITPDVELDGMVVAYVYDDGRWNQLPYVYPYYSNAEDKTWAENIRFDWTTNEVTFIVQDLDGGMPEAINNSSVMTFKVCVLR